MNRLAALTAAALTVGATVTTGASATALTTEDILSQFNLVTFGNVSGTSQVDGRSLIGGNLASSWMVFNQSSRAATPSAFAALTVGGNISGGAHVNNGGNAVVAGNVDMLNMNGKGSAIVGGTGTVQGGPVVRGLAFVPTFEEGLKESSAALAMLAGVQPTVVNKNKAVFDAAPTGGTTVYSLSLDFFSLVNEVQLALNGADTVIINVSGKSATLADNFLGNAVAAAPNVLWNFYEATSLVFDRQFVGSVIAPYADVTVRNSLEGTLVASSATINGRVGAQPFAGNLPDAAPTAVPAPAALPVFLAGLAGLAAAYRIRRKRAA